MSHNTMDLTQGSPLRQLLVFSLPLVAGTLFQQLYSFVDTVMVGRLVGEQALGYCTLMVARFLRQRIKAESST